MILVIMRILATIIDILVFFMVIIGFFVFIEPIFGDGFSALAIIALFVTAIGVPSLLQYPFMKVGQTIGKAFFGLHIVSVHKGKQITPAAIFHREIAAKLMSCYLICIPVLFGKIGPHEEMTETRIEKR